MRRSYLLGSFAIVFAAISSPVLAQDMGGPIGPGSSYGLEPGYDQGYAYDQGYYGPNDYDQGYGRRYYRGTGPVGAAAGVVGGAVNTAGAIATAPLRAFDNRDSYAMAPGDDGSYCAERYRSYDPASGTFMGYDGRRHPCP